MSWLQYRDEYQKLARTIEPSAIVVSKGHAVWAVAWAIGVVLTLGIAAFIIPLNKSWRRRSTTIGPAQGHPEERNNVDYDTIIHEGEHSRQYQILGWLFFPIAWINRSFRAWLGCIPFWILYFVIPFPVFICYGRYRLELGAAAAETGWMLRNNTSLDYVKHSMKQFAGHVAGKQYGWCWPKPWVLRGFDRMVKKEIADFLKEARNG